MIAKSDPASAGGERYSISYVTAEDESMTVKDGGNS